MLRRDFLKGLFGAAATATLAASGIGKAAEILAPSTKTYVDMAKNASKIVLPEDHIWYTSRTGKPGSWMHTTPETARKLEELARKKLDGKLDECGLIFDGEEFDRRYMDRDTRPGTFKAAYGYDPSQPTVHESWKDFAAAHRKGQMVSDYEIVQVIRKMAREKQANKYVKWFEKVTSDK